MGCRQMTKTSNRWERFTLDELIRINIGLMRLWRNGNDPVNLIDIELSQSIENYLHEKTGSSPATTTINLNYVKIRR